MAKKPSHFMLTLPPRAPETPRARWLYGVLRDAILEGRLQPGTRLPSTRDLASQYGLARGTVVQAFEDLKWEGYLESHVGSGTRVSRALPEELLHVSLPGPSPTAPPASPRRLSAYGRRVGRADYLTPGPVRPFRTNQPAVDLFPIEHWAQATARRLRRFTRQELLSCDSLGYRPLREAVASYLATSRGAVCTAEQVVIVSGVQEAFDLTARLLLDPEDRVGVERPGYEGAQQVLEAMGTSVVGVPVDSEGAVVDQRVLAGARLVYLTPAHQFPSGVAMSLPRRLAWLDWAASSEGTLFEDDYDSEFRYSGRPLPALQGLDRTSRVLLAGSFSKVLFPALRLGYLVVADELIDRFAAILSVTRRHTPMLEQAVLTDFIVDGHFGRHIRRMREIYAERLSVLLEAAKQRLAGILELSAVEAGLQTIAWLSPGLGSEEAARAAKRRNVDVEPLGSWPFDDGEREVLQLGFAAIGPDEIKRGVRDLSAALDPLVGV